MSITPDEAAAPWAEPWYLPAEPNEHAARELKRECSVNHVLYGIPVVHIASGQDCDDFLFCLMDGSQRYAVVHLTYAVETNPQCPWTRIYESLADFVARRLKPGIEEFHAGK